MKDESFFAFGEIEDEGKVSLCGYRQAIPIDTRRRLPEQFIVEWEFSDPQPNGLPSKGEHRSAVELQSMIMTPLEADNEAVLAIVSTENGHREWYFYCRDPQLLASRFNAIVKGKELPVKLHVGTDPDWEVYDRFVAPFVDKH